MSPQVEPALAECDEEALSEQKERQKRRGLLRTDTHTMYDVPFQVLDAVPTQELRKIAGNRKGDYSPELQAEARSILRAREDPQDRDTVEAEM
ncbi:MAG: hypothetical protein ACLQEQ_02125 [Nitrososphaerales archaeon]